jgi:hypothetical protein
MKRTMTISAFFLFLFLAGLQGFAHGQGKLGKIREAVRKEAPKQDSPKRESKQEKQPPNHRDSHGDENRGHRRSQRNRDQRNRRPNNDLGLVLSLNNFLTPVVEEVHVIHHTPQARRVPVSSSAPLTIEPIVAPTVGIPVEVESDYFPLQTSPSNWSTRLSMQGGTDFEDLTIGSLGLLLQPPGGLGLDTSVTMFRESGLDFRDNLFLGDVNLVFEPVASDLFRLRVGVGVNWLGDSYGGDAGFNMTTGFDWNLAPRWWMTGEVDLGTIGDTDLTHAQISLGRSLGQSTAWTTGYRYHDIGGVTIGSAFTGLQFRF